jgi:membrane protein implicated in regulation of membrane protease activity
MTTETLLHSASTVWLVCALIALAFEFTTGTLYLLVFSIALAGGGLAALPGLPLEAQYLAASVSGLVALVAVTAWKRRNRRETPAMADADIGQTVHILQMTGAHTARVHFRGTEWDARLLDDALVPGESGIIVGRDGNQLLVSSTH